MKTNLSLSSWSNLFLLTFFAVYLYILNEWLFAVTKPSYMNEMMLIEQLKIFFTISALLTSICFLCLLPLVILGTTTPLKRYNNILIKFGNLLPAVIFATLILIMVDNFTYTLCKFGIVSTDGWSRASYGLGFVLIICLCYQHTLGTLFNLSHRTKTWGLTPINLFIFLFGVLVLSAAGQLFPDRIIHPFDGLTNIGKANQHPHIILITADGVDANHMSVYGYERDTTPYLRKLAESALVAENAFAQAETSFGSVISIYTGKYPTKTRVLFPPDILRGVDSYEHLPGILREQGYKTIQITIPNYLDAYNMNVLDGFDEVKMDSAERYSDHSKYLYLISSVLYYDKALFADETINRVVDRIRHIFFIEKMSNPYLLVTGLAAPIRDLEKLETLKQEINNARQPIFAHVHLMGTHPKFNPNKQIFSIGQSVENQGLWNIDFYDDSILDLDRNIKTLIEDLTGMGLLDKTILIIGSDHGQNWDQLSRVPLIIRFPREEYAGTIQVNTQNLDIAPTILDYIGANQPGWMEGKSLISGDLEHRPIFGAIVINDESDPDKPVVVNRKKAIAPFNQFGGLTLIYCQKWYLLQLNPIGWEIGNIEGSTSVCLQKNEITDEEAFQWITEHLMENDFDLSTFPNYSSLIE